MGAQGCWVMSYRIEIPQKLQLLILIPIAEVSDKVRSTLALIVALAEWIIDLFWPFLARKHF
jgi:hypothetical protein